MPDNKKELTISEKNKIYLEVSLGKSPPENESPEAQEFRAKIEDQIDDARDKGVSTYVPFDLEL